MKKKIGGVLSNCFIRLTNLQQRILSSCIAIPIIFFLITHNRFSFFSLLGGVVALMIWEWWQLITDSLPSSKNLPALGIFGTVYILGAGLCLGRIYQQTSPTFFLWLLVGIIWTNDTFAYFGGRWLKGPRLAPSISPNKTWSGLFGGMIMGTLVTLCSAKFLNITYPFQWSLVPICLILSLSSHGGDLLESRMKRYLQVKDSGNILPGHGGVLDRCDSLLALGWVTWLMELFNIIRY